MPPCPYCRREDPFCPRWLIVIGSLALAVLAGYLFSDLVGNMTPHYSAAIDNVSGLEGPGDDHTLDEPLFTVTLRVTTRGFLRRDCVVPGSAVEVSYAGVTLAAGSARRSCAGLWTSMGQRVVAWGEDVRVPGFALDGLAADARRGVLAFDVAVWMPSNHDSHYEGTLVWCTGLRAGDAAALRSPCAVSNVDAAVLPVSSDVHGGGGN